MPSYSDFSFLENESEFDYIIFPEKGCKYKDI